jgi:SAM-dependent methyltransferase
MRKNIIYKSPQISEYYNNHRQKWDDFYESEKWVFERISSEKKSLGKILDVGCACGGLGMALNQKFNIMSYTGIDINREAIEWARKNCSLTVPSFFIAGDVLDVDISTTYDMVVSLSCADWNIKTDDIIDACWKRLKTDGYFVISLRLTPLPGINDIKSSYQLINFSGGQEDPEIANYVVFNFKEALLRIKRLKPQFIGAYGYYGKPSQTACTPFPRLVFAVFYIKKGKGVRKSENIITEFKLPLDIFL